LEERGNRCSDRTRWEGLHNAEFLLNKDYPEKA
jgi:hypothetical protein